MHPRSIQTPAITPHSGKRGGGPCGPIRGDVDRVGRVGRVGWVRSMAAAMLLASGGLLTAGCETTETVPPQDRPGATVIRPGNPGPVQTEITAGMMQQFSDAAARELAVTLPAAVADQPTKVVLGFAPISNQSKLSTTTLRLMNDRLRSRLISAPTVRGSYIIVSGEYADSAKLLSRFQPTTGGVVDPTGDGSMGRPTEYDPNLIYFLELAALEASGGGERQINLSVSLSHPMSRRTLLATTLDTTLRWSQSLGGWVVVGDQ